MVSKHFGGGDDRVRWSISCLFCPSCPFLPSYPYPYPCPSCPFLSLSSSYHPLLQAQDPE